MCTVLEDSSNIHINANRTCSHFLVIKIKAYRKYSIMQNSDKGNFGKFGESRAIRQINREYFHLAKQKPDLPDSSYPLIVNAKLARPSMKPPKLRVFVTYPFLMSV